MWISNFFSNVSKILDRVRTRSGVVASMLTTLLGIVGWAGWICPVFASGSCQ